MMSPTLTLILTCPALTPLFGTNLQAAGLLELNPASMKEIASILRSKTKLVVVLAAKFNNKALIQLHGPSVSMSDFQKKRVKRKTITLVKKVY